MSSVARGDESDSTALEIVYQDLCAEQQKTSHAIDGMMDKMVQLHRQAEVELEVVHTRQFERRGRGHPEQSHEVWFAIIIRELRDCIKVYVKDEAVIRQKLSLDDLERF